MSTRTTRTSAARHRNYRDRIAGNTADRRTRRRPRLSVDGIIDTALRILDEEGVDGLTTSNVARWLGVTQPALYSHFTNLDELRSAVAARGAQELSDLVRKAVAGKVADDALFAMARAYRDYVRKHPDRYIVQLSAGRSPAYADAMTQAAEAVREVLRSYGIDEAQVVEAHVAFRAAVHGFVHLEAQDALAARPPTPDEHFDFFVDLFAEGLRALSTTTRSRPPKATR